MAPTVTAYREEDGALTVAAGTQLLLVGGTGHICSIWTAIKWGLVDLTKLTHDETNLGGHSAFGGFWALFNPTPGTANMAATGDTGVTRYWAAAISNCRADEATLNANITVYNGSGTNPGQTITPKRGNSLCFDAMSCGDNESDISAPYAGQTEMMDNYYNTGSGNRMNFMGSYEPTANQATVEMKWTSAVSWTHYRSVICEVFGLSQGGARWFGFERWQGFLRDLKAGLVPPDQLRRRYGDLVAI